MAVDELIAEASASGVGHAVVTGGEPMIFEPITALCRGLRDAGLHVTIETAGTVHQPIACDLMSISPKLANSTPKGGDGGDGGGDWADRHEHRRLNPDVLQRLINEHPNRQLKFVVTGPADLAEIDDLLGQLTGWCRDDVFLMPEGTATPDPAAVRWIVDACLARGWVYGHRLHIELFGNTRGT